MRTTIAPDGGSPRADGWAIAADGLKKRFGDVVAVDGVDLRVPRGGVYGLLGPNGAGKTTVIRMLTTLARPDAGRVLVLGHDAARDGDAVRRRIALTGQYAAVDADLTGRENLYLLARLQGHARGDARGRARELLDGFGLADAAGRAVKTYSGGMRRRLDLAASLVVAPELLFLDEPTTGLDPPSRRELWTVVRALVDAGTTVLLTTQYLEEADALARRVAVIDDGRIVAEGTTDGLKARVGGGRVHVRLADPGDRERAADLLGRALGTAVLRDEDPATLTARAPDSATACAALGALAEAGVPVGDAAVGRPTLDEVFSAVTGAPREDGLDGAPGSPHAAPGGTAP